MATVSVQRIRLGFDGDPDTQTPPGDIQNQLDSSPAPAQSSGTPPFMWLGSDVQFEVAWLFTGQTEEVTNLASATLFVKDTNAIDGAPVMALSTSSFSACTTANWAAKTGQHAIFAFGAANTSFAIGATAKTFQVMLVAATTDVPSKVIVRGPAMLKILDGGTVATPPPIPPAFYGTAVILAGNDSVDVLFTSMSVTGKIIPFWLGAPQSSIAAIADTNSFTIQSGGPLVADTEVGYYVLSVT